MVMILCADSYQSPRSMEKELLRNLKLAAVNNPARNNSILKSFVTDLSFWDVTTASDAHCQHHHRAAAKQGNNKKRGRNKIPTLTEATKVHEKEEKEIEEYLSSSSSSSAKPVWKSAVDPATGRTYYYDAVTRKTQWNKPPELKALEKKTKLEKRRLARKFFDEMEKNIMKSLERGEVIPGIPLDETKKEGPPQEPLPKSRVRTISGMDDVLLAELRDDYNNYGASRQKQLQPQKHRQPLPAVSTSLSSSASSLKGRNPVPKPGRPPLPSLRQANSKSQIGKNDQDEDDLQLSPDLDAEAKHSSQNGQTLQKKPSQQNLELAGEKFVDAPIHSDNEQRQMENELSSGERVSPPGHARRNTGGTIYLQNTMTNPDIQATIKCVCGVYRAHIVQASQQEKRKQNKIDSLSLEYAAFNDDYWSHSTKKTAKVPPLTEVIEFYDAFYRRSQMEHDTIITSLIYVERVIKLSHGELTPNPENWRSLLFACMVLASKVWDDLSMWNVDFSNVSAHTAGLSAFTLRRINQLELELLKCLKFDVKVPASEYAKYYFLIRTMLLRSGLVKENEKPLQKRDAFRKLESLTSTYLKQQSPEKRPRDRRTKSMDDSISTILKKEELASGPVLKDSICLEQLIG
mmetsp:Transcript_7183/g.13285  ORF Transcript_7183/g.13285 Transcript_7183/m.13285 type:complete len:631 (-) Transcript_7183:117-2009(-)